MAAVLYLLGLISILLGAVVGADQFIDAYKLNLSLSVSYQAIVGGVLLFVMARLLQHAAATARNTEKFYQQVLHNAGGAAAVAGAPAPATKAEQEVEAAPKSEPAPETADAPAAEAPATEAPAAETPAAETPAADAAPAPAEAAEPTITEQIEYRGYMIDKLSNGKIDVHTAEGPMQFESLETFARELELSNG